MTDFPKTEKVSLADLPGRRLQAWPDDPVVSVAADFHDGTWRVRWWPAVSDTASKGLPRVAMINDDGTVEVLALDGPEVESS